MSATLSQAAATAGGAGCRVASLPHHRRLSVDPPSAKVSEERRDPGFALFVEVRILLGLTLAANPQALQAHGLELRIVDRPGKKQIEDVMRFGLGVQHFGQDALDVLRCERDPGPTVNLESCRRPIVVREGNPSATRRCENLAACLRQRNDRAERARHSDDGGS